VNTRFIRTFGVDGSAMPRVLVIAGLEPGERLIVKGHHFVGPDQPVTVRLAADSPFATATSTQARTE